ncbi:MAG: PQQ-binding-like beta-propeller repeat protein [Bdellovibrionales bacterium]
MDTELKKPFMKRFWWIGLIAVIIIAAIVVVPSIVKDLKEETQENYNDLSKIKYDPRVVATFKTPTGAAFKYSSPTIVDGYLYAGTAQKVSYEGDHKAALAAMPDNFFYKFDLDLKPIWSYPLKRRMVIGSSALDSKGNIYFVAEALIAPDNPQDKDSFFLTTLHLVSLTNDGVLRWEQPISEVDAPNDHTMIGVAIGADDSIYVAHDKFYAFDATGTEKWRYPTDDRTIKRESGSPIIDRDGNVYFVAPEPNNEEGYKGETEKIRAYKFRPTGGDPIWSTLLGNEIMDNEGGSTGGGYPTRSAEATPAFGLNQATLIAVAGATISKLDTATGELLWSTKPKGATGHFAASPVIDDRDNIYIGTKSNYEATLFSLDTSGSIRWTRLIGADLYDTPMLGDDGAVYVGSESTANGKFWAVDIETGSIRWSIGKDKEGAKISDFSMASGLIYNGHVYIGIHEAQNNGQILDGLFKIRVDAQNYFSGAAWPRFHGSNENTGRGE